MSCYCLMCRKDTERINPRVSIIDKKWSRIDKNGLMKMILY